MLAAVYSYVVNFKLKQLTVACFQSSSQRSSSSSMTCSFPRVLLFPQLFVSVSDSSVGCIAQGGIKGMPPLSKCALAIQLVSSSSLGQEIKAQNSLRVGVRLLLHCVKCPNIQSLLDLIILKTVCPVCLKTSELLVHAVYGRCRILFRHHRWKATNFFSRATMCVQFSILKGAKVVCNM